MDPLPGEYVKISSGFQTMFQHDRRVLPMGRSPLVCQTAWWNSCDEELAIPAPLYSASLPSLLSVPIPDRVRANQDRLFARKKRREFDWVLFRANERADRMHAEQVEFMQKNLDKRKLEDAKELRRYKAQAKRNAREYNKTKPRWKGPPYFADVVSFEIHINWRDIDAANVEAKRRVLAYPQANSIYELMVFEREDADRKQERDARYAAMAEGDREAALKISQQYSEESNPPMIFTKAHK